MIKDTLDGTTHFYNDGCGEAEHNSHSNCCKSKVSKRGRCQKCGLSCIEIVQVDKGNPVNIQYCDKCVQITNHDGRKCLKCIAQKIVTSQEKKPCECYNREDGIYCNVHNPKKNLVPSGAKEWEQSFDEKFKDIIRAEYNERDRMHRPLHPSDPRDEIKSFIRTTVSLAEQEGRRIQADIDAEIGMPSQRRIEQNLIERAVKELENVKNKVIEDTEWRDTLYGGDPVAQGQRLGLSAAQEVLRSLRGK